MNRATADPTQDQAEFNEASLVTAFNARMLSARQVAQTFVPPQSFYLLINSDNSLLSGPRGSGKTTMLKMLQPEALENWRHASAVDVRRRVTYTGVFIPTDRAWNAQLLPSMPEDMSKDARETVAAIADSAFATHVLRSMVQSMSYRAHGPDTSGPRHLRVQLDASDELHFVTEISSETELAVGPPNLSGLITALSRRLSYLGRLRKHAMRTRSAAELPNWVDQDCLNLAELAASVFNTVVGQPEHQWALLFDELELAPQRIVPLLLSALRGQNPRLMFKLSFSPVHRGLEALKEPLPATYGQDFEFIPLTYAKKRDALRFSRQLLQEELNRRGASNASPFDLLGPSLFESVELEEEPLNPGQASIDRVEGKRSTNQSSGASPLAHAGTSSTVGASGARRRRNPYSKGSRLWRTYKSLAENDPSFAKWLRLHKVDLDKLADLSPDDRAATLRKVRNLVVVRDFFRNRAGHGRSRKTYALYSGADSLLTLTDGNPRLLIAMFRKLLPNSMSLAPTRISEADQSRAIETAIDRFLVLIRSLEATNANGRPLSVQNVLDQIGQKLSELCLREDFSDNVPGTFRVDREVPGTVIDCLVEALNSGALIHIPQPGTPQVRSDLRNETFRLCYLLAPYYQLPLRMGRPISLSSLLPAEILGSQVTHRKTRPSWDQEGQPGLFDFPDATSPESPILSGSGTSDRARGDQAGTDGGR